jgi:glycosyltransferase involved in cell wall biosynthesis
MKSTLIFDDCLDGHHLEYLHHLYYGALDYSGEEFIFLLPEDFIIASRKLDWPSADNINLVFFNNSYLQKNMLKKIYNRTKILSKIIKNLKPSRVFLITLMYFIPFIFYTKTYNAKISGIIYNIYLYRWKNSKFIIRFLDSIKYYLMINSSKIERIFILNDKASACYLNKLYHTNKFFFLPDPINITESPDTFKDLRNDLEISPDKTVYLHLGVMDIRKGTLAILESIELLPDKLSSSLCFIFAGMIDDNILNSFNILIEKLKEKTQIIVINQFCDYAYLFSLCKTADYILIPYFHTSQSSGILGYAAFFKKPVIGPNKGIIGKIIKKYKLGWRLNEITPQAIANIVQLEKKNTDIYPVDYIEMNTIDCFINTIFNKKY